MKYFTTLESPIGLIRLDAEVDNHDKPDALVGIYFREHKHAPPPTNAADAHPFLSEAKTQIAAFFAGTRREFTLTLRPVGTPFQQQVWSALQQIPFGATKSYQDIANALSKPGAVRAVGTANGRNPLSIVIPCHRVIASSGALAGYAGGIEAKRWLLTHEGGTLK